MKKKTDGSNLELSRVLDFLLAQDINITVREVARNHASLRNASAFTRSPDRMEMIANAQSRQKQMRTLLNPHFIESKSLREKLIQAKGANVVLSTQLKALVASHAACIQAVMKAGGLSALERFWQDYKTIGETVRISTAHLERAEIVTLTAASKGTIKPKPD